MKRIHSIKFKLIATTILCAAVVTQISGSLLYRNLVSMIEQKSANIQKVHLTTLQEQMNDRLENAALLLILCANDSAVASALRWNQGPSLLSLQAQVRLNAYMDVCTVESYVNKLMVMNRRYFIQASARYYGQTSDLDKVQQLSEYKAYENHEVSAPYTIQLANSIQDGQPAVALLAPLNSSAQASDSYVYLEIAMDCFTDILAPYDGISNVFLLGPDGRLMSELPAQFRDGFDVSLLEQSSFSFGGRTWKTEAVPLSYEGMRLVTCFEFGASGQDRENILYVTGLVALTSLVLAVILAALVSAYLTRPIQKLNDRIRRITANDFSFDPEIERTSDEIGEIGHTVNEMTMSITHLLKETEEIYMQRQNIEISLLQSQVNPHFLYDTLDSIRWMAMLQKCPGIAAISTSLVNLLENIANGTLDKIPLREEIALLEDYVSIQSVRYLETFSFENHIPKELDECRIIKLTLQPLVENAIFHGIEPTGRCGTVRLFGRTEDNDVVLTVEDNGAGMDPETLRTLLTQERQSSRSTLSGIGVANVHKRLQLTYGSRYGLVVESELGRFTRVQVRFPREV